MPRHPRAVPAAVGRHDRSHAGLDGGDVAGHVDAPQVGLAHARVALVHRVVPGLVRLERHAARAVGGAAVAHVMLGAGQDAQRVLEVAALEAADGRPRQLGHERRVLGEALVAAAPTLVAGHGHAGCEDPLDARGPDLLRGHALDLLHERRVARGAQADVVGEDDRAQDVVVAVDGVDAVEERDLQPRLQRVGLDTVIEVGPVLHAVGLGVGVAAGEERAEEVGLDVLAVADLVLLGLDHLADLLLERHPGQQRLGLGVVGGETLLGRRGGGQGGGRAGQEQRREQADGRMQGVHGSPRLDRSKYIRRPRPR